MKFRFCAVVFFVLMSFAAQAAEPGFYSIHIAGNYWGVSNRANFLNGRIEKKLLEALDSIYKDNPSSYDFVYSKEEDELKVYAHCNLDFYSVVEGKLIKEYRYNNRGYNCGTKFFYRNQSYHILGGQGFWTNHMDLLRFEGETGSWEFTQAKNQPLDYFPIGTFQTKEGIVSLFGGYTNPRIPRLEKEPHGFFLDWSKKIWLPVQIETKGIDLSKLAQENPSWIYETEDYGFFVSNTQQPALGWNVWVLIEKASGKLFLYEGVKSFFIKDSPFREIIGNKITYFKYKEQSATEGTEVQIDLDQVRKTSKEIGRIVYLDEPKSTGSKTQFYFLGAGVLLFLFIFGLWKFTPLLKTRRTVDTEEKEGELEDSTEIVLDLLLAYDGEKLSTEDFDRILGIDQVTNFDSKRIKRARLIKEINLKYEEKKGSALITRIKNQDDKRFVYYKITF